MLDTEAQALSAEYTRITASAQFNGIDLFTEQTIGIQAGIDSSSNSRIEFDLEPVPLEGSSEALIGDGTFTVQGTAGAWVDAAEFKFGDLDDDGNQDLVFIASVGVLYRRGNGDGTFGTLVWAADLNTGLVPEDVVVQDFNNDGALDIVASTYNSPQIVVLLNDGSGSFNTVQTYFGTNRLSDLAYGDVDGDGYLDLISGTNYGGFISETIFINQGDGSFTASAIDLGTNVTDVELVDVNNDGNLDAVGLAAIGNNLSVRLGNGDGTFGSFTGGASLSSVGQHIVAGDLNDDGNIDFIAQDSANAQILFGNGDGTFSIGLSYLTSGGYTQSSILDLDGDGDLDFAATDVNSVRFFFNDGTGTFTEGSSFTDPSVDVGSFIQAADLNNDGVTDFGITNTLGTDSISPILQGTQSSNQSLTVSLLTEEEALSTLSLTSEVLDSLTTYQGQIGAALSRLEVAGRNASNLRDNSITAESRIRDADIAAETAELVRLQILQQATTAVLAQANQQPALVLSLLENIRGGSR